MKLQGSGWPRGHRDGEAIPGPATRKRGSENTFNAISTPLLGGSRAPSLIPFQLFGRLTLSLDSTLGDKSLEDTAQC